MFNKNPTVIRVLIFVTLTLVAGMNSASAFEVKVTYSNLAVSGPISFGIGDAATLIHGITKRA